MALVPHPGLKLKIPALVFCFSAVCCLLSAACCLLPAVVCAPGRATDLQHRVGPAAVLHLADVEPEAGDGVAHDHDA